MISHKLEKIFYTLLLFLFLSKTVTSQISYPRFSIDSLGQKIVELTIEQAQKLDNDGEMLILLQKWSSNIGKSDSICLKVIDDKEKVISSQKLLISNLYKDISNKEEMIKTLSEEVQTYKLETQNLTSQVENREGVIKENKKQIRKMKLKMIVGGGIGAAVIAGLLVLILVAH